MIELGVQGIFTAHIRRMKEGNIFSLFTPGGGGEGTLSSSPSGRDRGKGYLIESQRGYPIITEWGYPLWQDWIGVTHPPAPAEELSFGNMPWHFHDKYAYVKLQSEVGICLHGMLSWRHTCKQYKRPTTQIYIFLVHVNSKEFLSVPHWIRLRNSVHFRNGLTFFWT